MQVVSQIKRLVAIYARAPSETVMLRGSNRRAPNLPPNGRRRLFRVPALNIAAYRVPNVAELSNERGQTRLAWAAHVGMRIQERTKKGRATPRGADNESHAQGAHD